jgi:hypothetical protein
VKGLTRRRAIAAGAAGVAALGTGWYARFGLGDEFEEHVAGVMGIDTARATMLLERTRERLGDTEYDLRAAAFLAATTFPGDLLPAGAGRARAVQQLVGKMLERRADVMLYLGELDRPPDDDCQGLLRA